MNTRAAPDDWAARATMKLLVAVGREDIERYLSQQYEVSVVRHLEGVMGCVDQVQPDIVVITHHLPGTEDIYDVLWQVRTHPKSPRIIYLAGNRSTVSPEYMKSLVALGIYDILFNPFEMEDIDLLIHQPKTMADAVRLLNMSDAPKLQKRDPVVINQKKAHVVAVWSPTSSGASFVALNLAASAAMYGHTAAYVDVSETRAAHVWFQLPNSSALEGLAKDKEARGFKTKIPGLELFTQPPAHANGFCDAVVRQLRQLPYDLVVLDVGGREHFLTEHNVDEVWLVTDADPLHLQQTRIALQSLHHEHPDLHVRVIWNRDDASLEDFPFKADLRVPLYPGAYGWLHRGEFAMMYDQELPQKMLTLIPLKHERKVVQESKWIHLEEEERKENAEPPVTLIKAKDEAEDDWWGESAQEHPWGIAI